VNVTTSGEDPAQDFGDGAASEGQLLSDEDDLQAALLGLSRLVAGSDPLEALLTRVAEFAVRAIPGADGAGVTMYNDGTSSTVAASAPFVRDVDDIQYGLGEGPCISAAAQGRTIRAGSLGGDKQWPRFGPRVGRLGLHSALSLPLLVADEVIGAINVYAYSKTAFDEHAAKIGELYACSAAVAVHNARVLADARRLTSELQAALTTRAVIDQAVGIIISRSGATATEAFAALRTISQNEHTKLAVVAQRLVDEAARRARARHTQSR
jgi:transcriptional regulator with GAF, ATPase, and Fis domain